MFGKRERRLAILVLAVLGAYLADRLLLTPMFRSWRADGERGALLRRELAAAEGMAAALPGWRQERARRHALAFPANRAETENEALKILANGAVARSLHLQSIRPAWREEGSAGKGVPAQLELQVAADGTLAAVAGFLYDMETHGAPIRISRARLQSQDERGRALGIDLTLTVLAGESGQEDAE